MIRCKQVRIPHSNQPRNSVLTFLPELLASTNTIAIYRSMRPFTSFLVAAGIGILLLFVVFQTESWRAIPQSIGLGDKYGPHGKSTDDASSGVRIGRPEEPDPYAWQEGSRKGGFKEPKVESKSPYPVGETKPPGSNYTRCLVVPKLLKENVGWMEHELGDMIDSGLLSTAVYEMDNQDAPLHPVKNKGNEVMAYLSYVIDFYDDLPDVAIFMHYHRFAEHNNDILNKDASLMVRHLSPERVTRDGYMNLRCHWDPGCPDWIHPGVIDETDDRPEQHRLAESWAELFPDDQIPTILAQPCCGQFAVSRERILAIPKERFLRLRDWVLRTELSSFISGRIFEYLWQYILGGTAIHCPSMSACYCDGYGLCFGDAEKFDYYFELNFYLARYEKELQQWDEKAQNAVLAHDRSNNGGAKLDLPKPERDGWLRKKIQQIKQDMSQLRDEAFRLGSDPEQRAKEAGRAWKPGDGF